MNQRVSQCVAMAVLLAACVGMPVLLVTTTGLPWAWPWAELAVRWQWSRPVSPTHMVYGLVAVTWLLWAFFVAVVGVEVWNATVRRGLPPLRLPGSAPAQPVVRRLVAAALMTAAVAPVGAMAHAAQLSTGPDVAVSMAGHGGVDGNEAAPVLEGVVQAGNLEPFAGDGVPVYVVAPPEQAEYDCLWDIAERHLGDPMRWREIMDLNQDPNAGVVISDPDVIHPGWVLRMPADAVGLTHGHVTGGALSGAGVAAGGDEAAAETEAVSGGGAVAQRPVEGTATGGAASHARAALGELVRASGDGGQVDSDASSADTAAADVVGAAEGVGPKVAPPDDRGGVPAESDPGAQGVVGSGLGDPETAQGPSQGAVVVTPPDQQPVPVPNVADDETQAIAVVPAVPEVAVVPGAATATVAVSTESVHRIVAGAGVLADRVLDEVSQPGAMLGVAGCQIATVLAGGVLGVATSRRIRQRNRRRPGQRIAMPSGVIADAERMFRAVPSGVSAQVMDAALRQLASQLQAARRPYPVLHGVHVSRHTVSLYCAQAAAPVGDWVSDEQTPLQWTLPVAAVTEDAVGREVADRPYPAVVVVGQDPDGGVLLLDTETAGVLSFTGPLPVCVAAADALLVELLTSPWSASCEVTIVAQQPQEVSVLTADSRVRHARDVVDELGRIARRMDERRSILAEDGHASVLAARAAQQSRDVWAPQVVFFRDELTAAQRETLRDLANEAAGVGIVFVTAGGKPVLEWEVRFAPDAQLGDADTAHVPLTATFLPGDTTIWPQVLPPQLRDQVAQLLAVTEQPAGRGPEWAVTVAPAPSVAQAVSPTEVPALKPVADIPELVIDAPVCVRLLGPVDVAGAPGEPPRSVGIDQHHGVTELLALLLLREEPVTPADVSAVVAGRSGLWSERTVHTRLAQARTWLGEDDAGNLRVPHVGQGEALVLSADVTSDWAVFLAAVGPEIAGKTSGELLAALRLVSGPPCVGEGHTSFSWAADIVEEMTQSIVDVAHQCVTVALSDHQLAVAREAAAVGRLVDPYSDLMWQHSLRIEGLAGDASRRDELQREYRVISSEVHLEPSAELSGLLAATAGSVA